MKKSTELETTISMIENMSYEEAQRFVRKVMGPSQKRIVGEKYERIMTLLRLKEPYYVSNNQTVETEKYIVGNKDSNTEYHVIYFPTGEPELMEILKEENE